MASADGTITVTATEFKEAFPEFSTYTDAQVSNALTEAICYISNSTYGKLSESVRTLLIELMAAHLIVFNNYSTMSGGLGSAMRQSSTVGSVSVTFAIPNNRTQFQSWINQTAYGQRYWNILSAHNAVGFYFGGSFQRKFTDNMMPPNSGNMF